MGFLQTNMIFMENPDTPEIESMLRELYKMNMNRARHTEPIQKIKKAYKHLFKTPDESPYKPKLRL
jgi:effector-binding domain-containing protein